LGDAEIREELRKRLGCHRGPAIGVNDKALRVNAFAYECLREHFFGEYSALTGLQPPRNNVTTKHVENDVQAIMDPLLRPW
jgi:hypothetical protein